jgi:hypothetical protein
LGTEGYLVWDEHVDAVGDTAKAPELASSVMAVPVDDPATTYDDSSVLLFAAAVTPLTNDSDWAFVALDINGDLTDDYYLQTPNVLMVADENYTTEIGRFDGANWIGTGQPAVWQRVADGYVAGLDWRRLGLTFARFAFGLSDQADALNDWAPDDYVGQLVGLPQPDSDGDGLSDAQDACPTVYGMATYGGCLPPDSDGDGISDPQDACPTVWGPAGIGGCPDSDADGVIDARDACPVVSGAAAYAGCPPPPSVIVKARSTRAKSRLYVDVNPNQSSGYWKFQVQRKKADGTWQPLKTYRTKGAKETRTINLKKGTYQWWWRRSTDSERPLQQRCT